ncbi:MAG TPA: hypothetical protein DGU37_07515, partial [Microbacterium sp.]|nr:hypothetical protein [Microbacterium sp.]
MEERRITASVRRPTLGGPVSRALGASRARILTAAAALALSALALAGCSTSGEQPDSADAGYVTP